MRQETVDLADLRQVWAQIPDPRDRRGRRHPLTEIPGLAQAANVPARPPQRKNSLSPGPATAENKPQA